MANQTEAQTAIFIEIERQAKSISDGLNSGTQASIIKDLAAAYRLAAGGPQPGGSVISS